MRVIPSALARSSASLPMKGTGLESLTANPSPASYGLSSGVMSAPHTRYPFSNRMESMARYPAGTRPWVRPAAISVSNRRTPNSMGG